MLPAVILEWTGSVKKARQGDDSTHFHFQMLIDGKGMYIIFYYNLGARPAQELAGARLLMMC